MLSYLIPLTDSQDCERQLSAVDDYCHILSGLTAFNHFIMSMFVISLSLAQVNAVTHTSLMQSPKYATLMK